MGIDMLLIKISTGNQLFGGIYLDDLKRSWTPKIRSVSVYCDVRLRCTLQGWIATKWLKIDQDNVRKGTAKTVERLMSFSQITCLSL